MILFAISMTLVSAAVTGTVNVADSFGVGDVISFDYTITSDSSELEIVQYTPSFSCDVLQPGTAVMNLTQVSATQSASGSFTGPTISSSDVTQDCKAFIMIENLADTDNPILVQEDFEIINGESTEENTDNINGEIDDSEDLDTTINQQDTSGDTTSLNNQATVGENEGISSILYWGLLVVIIFAGIFILVSLIIVIVKK